MPDPEFVRYERDGKVGVITLDRPPLNTYDAFLEWELEQAWVQAEQDAEARVIVLRAEGKHFCAGASMQSDEKWTRPPPGRRPWEDLDFIQHIMKPTIAAIQGGCIGGGQRFVFPCDLLFCTEDAFFRDPLAQVGGIGGIQASVHTWLYGPRLAKEMLFSGGRLPAARLYATGAVNRLYPTPDALRDGVLEFAHEIAETNPLALRQAKRSVNITMDIMGQHYIRNRFAELLDEAPVLRPQDDDE